MDKKIFVLDTLYTDKKNIPFVVVKEFLLPDSIFLKDFFSLVKNWQAFRDDIDNFLEFLKGKEKKTTFVFDKQRLKKLQEQDFKGERLTKIGLEIVKRNGFSGWKSDIMIMQNCETMEKRLRKLFYTSDCCLDLDQDIYFAR